MLPGGHLSKADRLKRDTTYNLAEVKLGDVAFRKPVVEEDADGDDDSEEDDDEDATNDDGWASTSASEDASSDANDDASSGHASDSS